MCDDNERKWRVLVIDDSKDVRDSLHYVLGSYGYEVVGCTSGMEAIELMANRHFDYVVADRGLPDMGGIELTRLARRILPRAVIIGMSGLDIGEDFLRAGANDFRRKPVIPYEIAMMIDGADITETELVCGAY